jgi:hypothetical protein
VAVLSGPVKSVAGQPRGLGILNPTNRIFTNDFRFSLSSLPRSSMTAAAKYARGALKYTLQNNFNALGTDEKTILPK